MMLRNVKRRTFDRKLYLIKPLDPPANPIKSQLIQLKRSSSQSDFDHQKKRRAGILSLVMNDRGNVESALVLIPLMILFLSIAQICISVYSRNITGNLAQGEVAYRAIGDTTASGGAINAAGPFEKSVVDPNSSSTIAMPLPGGGSVLVGEKTVKSPVVTPLLPQGDIFKVQGIAVQE